MLEVEAITDKMVVCTVLPHNRPAYSLDVTVGPITEYPCADARQLITMQSLHQVKGLSGSCINSQTDPQSNPKAWDYYAGLGFRKLD